MVAGIRTANAKLDRVCTVATQHDLLAIACRDRVVATQIGRATASGGLRVGADRSKVDALRIHLHVAVVTQNGVRTVACGDGIAAHATQDCVVAVACRDRVITASRGQRVAGGEVAQQTLPTHNDKRGVAIVSQHNVVAAARGDVVATRSTHDDIGSVTCIDGISCTDGEVSAGHVGQDAIVAENNLADAGSRRAGGNINSGSIVTDNHSSPVSGGDVVAASSTNDRCRTIQRRNRVAGSIRRGDALDVGQQSGRIERGLGVVTSQEVAAVSSSDVVGACPAEDNVIATTGIDGVAATVGGVGRGN